MPEPTAHTTISAPAPPPPPPTLPAARRARRIATRVALALLLSCAAIALAVLASIHWLSTLLIIAAALGMAFARTRHLVGRGVSRRPVRAYVLAGAVVIGLFVILTVAGELWPR